MVQTTNIEFRGDRIQAEELSLNHTVRLLEDFRKGNSFQNLLINSVTKNFYTDTGDFIGTIFIQTTHGVENVIVTVPVGKKKKPKKEKEKVIDVIELIVPIIRDKDNEHWLACLSGTFDGPYVYFPNLFDISDDTFYEFAQEIEYDNQLVSVGESVLNGSINPPELYLVAPTGETPDEDGYHSEEYDWRNDNSGSSQYSYISGTIWLCVGTNLGGYRDDYTGSSVSTTHQDLYIFEEKLESIIYDLSTSINLDRAWVFCSTATEPPPTTEQDVIDACSGRDYLQIDESEFFSEFASAPAGLEYENKYKTIIGEGDSPWSLSYSVRAERADINNHIICYRTTFTETIQTSILEFDPCSSDTPDTTSDTTTTYCDYIRVDGEEFAIRNRTDSSFPKFFQRDMKYFNTDSPAAVTAIAASNQGNQSTNYEKWLYFYIGPNSDEELHTTEFIPEAGEIFHIIPNAPGIDDSVLFNGKIFLGMIRYEIEREKSI